MVQKIGLQHINFWPCSKSSTFSLGSVLLFLMVALHEGLFHLFHRKGRIIGDEQNGKCHALIAQFSDFYLLSGLRPVVTICRRGVICMSV